jgi:hypothetical protein
MSPPLTRCSTYSYTDRLAADFLAAGIQGGNYVTTTHQVYCIYISSDSCM